MATEVPRTEALIIMVQSGRAQSHNSRLWADWVGSLPVYKTAPDQLLSTLQEAKDAGSTHVWLADASYEPLPTTFRLYLSKFIWDESKFTIFRAAKPTFARTFYAEKLTADYDCHDKYGGLRYLDVDAALDETQPVDFDKTCMGQDIDYLDHQAAKLSFPHSAFHLTSYEPPTQTVPAFESIRRRYSSVQPHWSEGTILEAHRELAAKSDSQMFIVFDGDFILTEPLGLESFKPWDEKFVHVWYARNPLNGLVYGHGGPKAFNKNSFDRLNPDTTVDVTTSSNERQMVVHAVPVGYHRFNWSAESSFRTAFREVAKLTWLTHDRGQGAGEAAERMTVWLNEECYDQDQEYWEECVDGASLGHAWALTAEPEERALINNWLWLHEQYEEYEAEALLELEEDDEAADFEHNPEDED